jgi:putative acetyltransferase
MIVICPQSAANLRPVADSDGERIAGLIAACFAEYEGCLFVWEEFPELRAPARWAAGRGTAMWVAERAGAIVGCVCATPSGEGVELHKFYVDAGLRGSGLAQTLFGLVAETAARVGACRIWLWSDARFTRAHRFYEKMGFQRGAETRALDDVSNTIEFFFARDLTAAP